MRNLALILALHTSAYGFITSSQISALRDLAVGIEKSDVELVKKTVRKHPFVLSVRISSCGDTPLMAAVRKYGQTLQSMVERPTKITAGTVLCGLLMGIAAGELVSHCISPASGMLTGAVTFTAACAALTTKSPSSEEQVISYLIRVTPDRTLRNREGLTALDILHAYHHYAQELKETSWFHFHALLQQN